MSDEEKNVRRPLSTFRQLLARVQCFCPRCNTRLKLSPAANQLRWAFIKDLLDGKRFTIPGYLTIEVETHGGHWTSTTLIPYWPYVRHKPSWVQGYKTLQLRERSSMKWRLRKMRERSEPQGKPPTDWS